MQYHDPFALDRSLAAYARLERRFRSALAEGTAEDHVFEVLPPDFSAERLRELRGEKSDPFEKAAARWMARLLLEHALIPERSAVAHAYLSDPRPLDKPEQGPFTVAELFDKALEDGPRRAGWLDGLAAQGGELGARRLALFEALGVKARELGADLALGAEPARLVRDAGARLVAATRDAVRELGVRSLTEWIALGLGTDAVGDWPVNLGAQRLGEWFREGRLLDGLSPELGAMPRMLGSSSGLRALSRFGRAFHDAGASPQRPFALARDPYALRSRRFGALFSLLPFHASFAERKLGVGRGRFSEYRRALGRVLLLAAHSEVVRAELAFAAWEGTTACRRAFAEQLPELFGFEIPPRLAGVVFADEQAPRQLAALFEAVAYDRSLTDRHDEDWFRNPRALEELRGEIESVPELEVNGAAVEHGGRLFSESLLAAG